MKTSKLTENVRRAGGLAAGLLILAVSCLAQQVPGPRVVDLTAAGLVQDGLVLLADGWLLAPF